MKTIPEEEYTELCDDYMGICLACGEYKDSVEPDAEKYECECCGAFEVYGIEQALVIGAIDIG